MKSVKKSNTFYKLKKIKKNISQKSTNLIDFDYICTIVMWPSG